MSEAKKYYEKAKHQDDWGCSRVNKKKIAMELEPKKILDATCGARMMWFDKQNPNAIFADARKEKHILCDGRVLEIAPDIQMDFTQMPFDDDVFNLVVFDPPHLDNVGANSWMAKKYGRLPSGWPQIIKAGFDECMRVLKDGGVLIFKWSENQVKVGEVIRAIGVTPLFGHTTSNKGQTIWMTFIKIKNHD